MVALATPGLERLLRREIAGEVLFDTFSRGRYATDASIYQMMPVGVVVPKSEADVAAAIAIADQEGVPVLPRGGGTSQCGQTVNHALVIDTSRHLNGIIELDVEERRCVVRPGLVLDQLNRALKQHGLWFPVDVSTASRATIGGMAGNNSCGGRSIRYGMMRDNVRSIRAILADGTEAGFGPVPPDGSEVDEAASSLTSDMLALGVREAAEIGDRFPGVMRRVGGYNIDALVPTSEGNNLAHLLVGSEGTLAFSTAIELELSPELSNRVLGVCHFPTFHKAMDAAQHLVKLGPIGVELVDATMIALAREIPMFRETVDTVVRGEPEALLLVEFAEGTAGANKSKLRELDEAMGDIGLAWTGHGNAHGGVVPVDDHALQASIAEVRKSGLNIMMSMKTEGKPVSFVEDCAVPLADLAEYTSRLTDIFERHGTRGTWYAHASVGCLHVRPVLNMKLDGDVGKMRAIAEEAFDLVRNYRGSHSGEHGDGIVRSEFHETMFGARMVAAFTEVKNRFDPKSLFNPGKIVAAPKMDDRSLFRYGPDYSADEFRTELDWSDWTGAGGGFQGAVEMCNNNGACRKQDGGVMCPSFRVTGNERDVTRGRANVLRLAISGQFGAEAFTSDAMADAMRLCVSCKACRRECPTGVDMARMKTEVLAARARQRGISLHDRLVAYLPRYAPVASRLPWVMNARDSIPGLAGALEGLTGFSTTRTLPTWRLDHFRDDTLSATDPGVVLFADTFNRYFEPENLLAAGRVLRSAGYAVDAARAGSARPLCCGRTFLSVGLVDQARVEARRLVEALLPFVERGIPVVGLEPSCLLTLRDEVPALLADKAAKAVAGQAVLFEEFVSREADRFGKLAWRSPAETLLLHGHCHQKAFNIMPDIEATLRLLPETKVTTIESGCCGMAGAFGYGAETLEVSMKMGELSLFPAVRASDRETLVVADGTSCRQQIADGTGRRALHAARVMDMSLGAGQGSDR